MLITFNSLYFLTIKNGMEERNETIHIIVMTALVLRFVTRTWRGNIMAMNLSQEIAESVKTLEVKHVTGKENSYEY